MEDGEEAGHVRMDKKLREQSRRYNVTELRKFAAIGKVRVPLFYASFDSFKAI